MTKNEICVKISIDLPNENKTSLNCYYAVKGSTKMEEIAQLNSATQGLDLYICMDEKKPSDSCFTPSVLEKIDVHKYQNKTMVEKLEKTEVLDLDEGNSNNSLMFAAKYLATLYENTYDDDKNPKYSCSTTKLGKLLTLAAWIHSITASENRILFSREIISKRCGTTFRGLTDELSNVDFTVGKDTNSRIEPSEIRIDKNINDYLRRLLLFVFQVFGAYESYCLGFYINEYKPQANENMPISIDDFYKQYEPNDSKYKNNLNSLASTSSLDALSSYIKEWESNL